MSDQTVEDPKTEDANTEDEKKKNSGSNFYKQKLEQLIEENKSLKEHLETEKTKVLTEKENFKELWELEKRKRVEIEDKNKKLSQNYVNYFKTTAIKEEALKSGILEQALDDIHLVDNSMVQVETTDRGNINVHGSKEFVEHLKEVKPHWFRKINAPNINTNNSTMPSQPKELTAKELLALEKSDPVKYREEMTKRINKK